MSGDDCRCPIALALCCSVFGDNTDLRWDVEYEENAEDEDGPAIGARVPASIREFVHEFDRDADDESETDPLTLVEGGATA